MQIKLNVLYLSYDGMTDPLGQSQVLPYLAGLSKKGITFHLISFEKIHLFEQKKDLIERYCLEHNIYWYPQIYTKTPPIISTLYDIYKFKKVALKLIKEQDISILHCRSYISATVAYLIKKKKNIQYIFDMRGFWVDERIEGTIWNYNNPIYKLLYHYLKKLELNLFSQADVCVSLTEAGKTELKKWKLKRTNPLPIYVIPCCVDMELFNYNTINEEEYKKWLNKLKLQETDYIISYLGSLSTVYRFDKVLEVINRLKNKNAAVKFVIITNESESIVNNYIEKAHISDSSYIKTISLERKDVPIVLSLCHYSIYFYIPSFSRKGTSPTRLAELLACGVKVISNAKVGDTKEVILDNQFGYVLEDFSDNELNRLVDSFNFEKNYEKNKLRAKAMLYYDLQNGVEKYFEVYQDIKLKK
jgi:glycosyltransferase involved in cell wall biosynthesis